MLSSFGKNIKVSIFGGSHESHIGVTITGLPVATEIDMSALQAFLKRRAPGSSPFATSRKEPDLAVIQEGASLHENIAVTTEDAVTFIIKNTNTRSQDYQELRDIPRPGHADFTAYVKYGDTINMAGGGPFSARMTAPLCIAGGIALQLLKKQGMEITAHIYSIEQIQDTPFDPVHPQGFTTVDFPVFNEEAGKQMQQRILTARDHLDSVGGIVEACITGCPAGLGGPMYDGVESVLAPILFGIPAVKGVEFGAGFSASRMTGSQNNDPFILEDDQVKTATNHHGGILGGITSGMPIIARVAFKPTPSIAQEQKSVSLSRKQQTTLSIRGRHDPCVVLRAVPVVEAALAIGLLDILYD